MNIVDIIKTNQGYFEDFVTRATHHSNRIEGNTLSMAETYHIIFDINSAKINAKPRDFYEAINHKYAIDYILKMGDKLTEKDVINIAKLVNKNLDEIDGYRSGPVLIRGAEHMPPPAAEVRQLMMFFVDNYNADTEGDIFHKIALNHIQFERIHPFGDGNGRTGRLIIIYELLKNNIAPAIITADNKIDYLNYIAEQDVDKMARLLKAASNKEAERIEIATGEKICSQKKKPTEHDER